VGGVKEERGEKEVQKKNSKAGEKESWKEASKIGHGGIRKNPGK